MAQAQSRLFVILMLQLVTVVIASFPYPSTGPFNHSVQANVTFNASQAIVAAPYFRNVSAGDAWVVPGTFDLGARSMLCECFDPSGMYSVLVCVYQSRWGVKG